MNTYRRPRLLENGSRDWSFVQECGCGEARRGPAGGVCGGCGGAITAVWERGGAPLDWKKPNTCTAREKA